MNCIVPGPAWPLHDTAGTRRLEQTAAAVLPPHTLMQRAGLAVARLARALAPHARSVWIACGPGNNGGDGLEAAALLAAQGLRVTVTWLGQEDRLPADARASLARARGLTRTALCVAMEAWTRRSAAACLLCGRR